MIPEPPPADRRAALRQRHRRAIVDAAAALLDERNGAPFTVDELAARADVARRTVFNHFSSVDDVVAEVGARVLGEVAADFGASAAAPRDDERDGSLFDELAELLRATDLVAPMAYLTRVLGSEGCAEPSPRVTAMVARTFTDLSERLVVGLSRRHPEADLLDVQLLVASFMSGIMVVHRHWWEATGAADDAASREVWSGLLDHLVERARHGHAAPSDRTS
ncbi:TetR/AcrR family transcriptional regulator [Cellulosimicrobium sp. Marseille-Q4280]|uniref:TetR/AcrR family transcriptional regulator n=1 Tax=Cellulosimicrobium sp. Marseille-Q4280 TaxID=2937992 RepID=UPI00203E283D|nr:TetR/AcrR family transcriptional regulator [Cellulosimicrobium sp. Marseille-Q4280]